MRFSLVLSCLTIWTGLTDSVLAEDLVEFLSGAKIQGTIKAIRKDAQEFDFETSIAGRTYVRTYTYDKVEAVTINGKRHVLNSKPSDDSGSDRTSTRRTGNQASTADSPRQRSRTEIDRLIEEAGKSPPDWYESTPLEYPPGLDLSWPEKPPNNQWNSQKNVGQYIWDVINPNPDRWRSGTRLVHHLMSQHRDNPRLLARDMNALSGMYFRFFQDYPRAAFWLRKTGADRSNPPSVRLAECYWRMGNKAMALELLNARSVPAGAIKLYGDMGETQKALQLVEAYAKTGQTAQAYMMGADACRLAGRYDDAIRYYQKVPESKGVKNEEYRRRFNARAKESIEALRLLKQADPEKVADGTYTATGTGYTGPVAVQVTVAGGRIEAVRVTKHTEKQFYAALTDIPKQITSKQSVQGIDAVSGATITSQAIVNATAKALASGAR